MTSKTSDLLSFIKISQTVCIYKLIKIRLLSVIAVTSDLVDKILNFIIKHSTN